MSSTGILHWSAPFDPQDETTCEKDNDICSTQMHVQNRVTEISNFYIQGCIHGQPIPAGCISSRLEGGKSDGPGLPFTPSLPLLLSLPPLPPPPPPLSSLSWMQHALIRFLPAKNKRKVDHLPHFLVPGTVSPKTELRDFWFNLQGRHKWSL